MSSRKQPHPRWDHEGFQPQQVAGSGAFDAPASGPKRRAPLLDRDGVVVGDVWTDGKQAAGFTPSDAETSGSAASYVYRVHANLKAEGKPASSVLDPAPYAPLYKLQAAPTVDDMLRRSR